MSETRNPGQKHKIVSQEEWLAARKALLKKEKDAVRVRDQLSEARRELPWVKVDRIYLFDGPNGKVSLADLFAGRRQLVVYHFMFGPDWKEGCPSCSFVSDHLGGALPHLAARDVSLAVISRAPFNKLAAFKQRMDWKFNWVSSFGSTFNGDYHVSFTPEEIATGKIDYNFSTSPYLFEELPGISVFIKGKDGSIYRTYSAYSRGLDVLIGAHHYLDLTPLGRNEEGDGKDWVKYHDRYEEASGPSCCQSGK